MGPQRMQTSASTRKRILAWTCGLRPLLPVALLAAVAVAAFWPSMSALADLWSDPFRRTYQHGYLVVAIVVWLVYRERQRLAVLPAVHSVVLLAAGLAGSIAWAVAVRAGLQTVHVVLWPLVLWCIVAGVLGWRAGRLVIFPFAYLYLAMPIWEPLLPWLQHATVAANRLMIGVAGVPAWVEGNSVHLAAGTFAIDERCSGLSYLVAGLSLAVLLGKINHDTVRRRWLLVLLAGALALLSNWLRVFVVIVAGHLTDMQHYFVRVDHIGLGWVLFGIVFAGFFVIVRRLPDAAAPAPEPPADAAPVRVPRPVLILAGAAMLAAGPLLLLLPGMARDDAGAVVMPSVEIAGWAGPADASGAWHPVFAGADGESLADYALGERKVAVYAATFMRQEQGRELTGFGNSVYGAAGGGVARSVRRFDADTDSGPVPMAEAEWMDAAGNRALIWWTYQVGDRRFSNGFLAQVSYGIASLLSSPVSSAVVLRSGCIPDCGMARETLGRFAGSALPALLAAAGHPEQSSQTVPGLKGMVRDP